jgi:hypothetical protein
VKVAELHPNHTSQKWHASRYTRYFFILLALFGIAISAMAFVPQYLKFAAGTFPIALGLHIHGVLMGSWLAIFFAQALLAMKGRLALHRKLGRYGILLGMAVWVSMVLVELRRKVLYPLEPEMSEEYDADLASIYVLGTFLFFFVGAIYQRGRWPAWHKRFMTFATIAVLQGPEARNIWLPRFAPGYWTDAIYLDAFFLLPLLAYDYFLAKRLHPATIAGSCMLLGAQGVVILLWGNPWWRHFAYSFTVGLRTVL